MMKYIFLSLVFLLTSCKKEEESNKLPDYNEQGLLLNQKIQVGGTERDYHIYIPTNHTNNPVVVLLHGHGGSADKSLGLTNSKAPQEVWLSLAEQNDFIVVVPNGSFGADNKRGWNDCRNDAQDQSTADDVLFISQLLQKVKTTYNYNSDKVFIAGVSNGGIMALRLAIEMPEKITAFSGVVTPMPENTACISSTLPVSSLFMNGTADPIIPFEGGEIAGNGGIVKSAQETVDYWVNRNGISENPVETSLPNTNGNDDCTADKFLYKNGSDNTEVAFYKIINGGHTEPSISERHNNIYLSIVGNQNGDFEMAAEIWNFFKDKSK